MSDNIKTDDPGRIEMRPLLAGETTELRFDFSFDFIPDNLLSGIRTVSPARVTGRVTDSAGYIRLTADITLDYKTECARCTKEIDCTLNCGIDKTTAPEGELENEENDDYIVYTDGVLDMRSLAEEEIYLSFPLRSLCSEDCRGLCPKCGKDLNEGDCSCPAHEPDPRLAVLKNWSENNR